MPTVIRAWTHGRDQCVKKPQTGLCRRQWVMSVKLHACKLLSVVLSGLHGSRISAAPVWWTAAAEGELWQRTQAAVLTDPKQSKAASQPCDRRTLMGKCSNGSRQTIRWAATFECCPAAGRGGQEALRPRPAIVSQVFPCPFKASA